MTGKMYLEVGNDILYATLFPIIQKDNIHWELFSVGNYYLIYSYYSFLKIAQNIDHYFDFLHNPINLCLFVPC